MASIRGMRPNSSTPTAAKPTIQQTIPMSGLASLPNGVLPEAGGNTMSWAVLRDIVLPLPALLAANSHVRLINPNALREMDDPHRTDRAVRLCYRLAPQFFREETSLDRPLVALLRTSRRGHTVRRWPLRITTELALNTECGQSGIWSTLVISAPRDFEREACVEYLNRLLHSMWQYGCFQPLNREERAMLGRPPAPHGF